MSGINRSTSSRRAAANDPERPKTTALNKQTLRTLYSDERARGHFRQSFYDNNPSARKDAPFEELFEAPSEADQAPDLQKSAVDLDECVSMFINQQSMDVGPMNRFFIVHPSNEQTAAQGRKDMNAIGLQEGGKGSAKKRVLAAAELAEIERREAQRRRERKAARKQEDRRERNAAEAPRSWYVERNDESWLDLNNSDEDESGSCSTVRDASKKKRHDSRQ